MMKKIKSNNIDDLALASFKRLVLDYLETTVVPDWCTVDDEELKRACEQEPLIVHALSIMNVDADILIDALYKIKNDKEKMKDFCRLYHKYVKDDEDDFETRI